MNQQRRLEASDTIRVARMDKHERRAILLMTPDERKAALLSAALQLQAELTTALQRAS